MAGRNFLGCRFVVALTGVGLILAGGSAIAQQPQEITIVSQHRVVHTHVGTTSIGIPIEEVSLNYYVHYGDLNLNNVSDVNTLRERVRDAAKESCEQLNRVEPDSSMNPPVPSDQDCVKSAIDGGMQQVDADVAAAQH